jgi:hypothetical protein
MYPHRIRLRGPWYYLPLRGVLRQADGSVTSISDGDLPLGTVKLPCRWGDVGFGALAGTVRFIRHFGLPRQLDPHERVWLEFTNSNAIRQVSLNAEVLPGRGDPDVEITARLKPRNELAIVISEDDPLAPAVGDVTLEIRATAWLASLHAELVTGRLRISGDVRGHAERPLDLYAILDRGTVAQATTGTGLPFELSADQLPAGLSPGRTVRVELLNGGRTWYTADVPIALPPAENPP